MAWRVVSLFLQLLSSTSFAYHFRLLHLVCLPSAPIVYSPFTVLPLQNALHAPALTQFGMNWGLLLGSLLIAAPTFWKINDTNLFVNDGAGAGYSSREGDGLDVKIDKGGERDSYVKGAEDDSM